MRDGYSKSPNGMTVHDDTVNEWIKRNAQQSESKKRPKKRKRRDNRNSRQRRRDAVRVAAIGERLTSLDRTYEFDSEYQERFRRALERQL